MAYRLTLRGVRGDLGFGLPHGPNAVKHKTPFQAPLPISWAAGLGNYGKWQQTPGSGCVEARG